MKKQKLVIVGAGEFAEIAHEYFEKYSEYSVRAFAVEKQFIQKKELLGKPVAAFEDLASMYPPGPFKLFVAVTFTGLNRVRARLYEEAKAKGYQFASFVSPYAFVWDNVKIGENCFIFENNVLQYHAEIGNNVILWSGNHVGHRTVIGDHCFISSHVVISGYCSVGKSCFFGVNSSVGDNVVIADDCVIGAGALILKNTEAGKVYKGGKAVLADVDSLSLFKVKK